MGILSADFHFCAPSLPTPSFLIGDQQLQERISPVGEILFFKSQSSFGKGPFRVVLGQAYPGLTGGFLTLRIFSVAISVSHVCFILDLILVSMFLS